MRFSIKNSREESVKYFLLFGFTYVERTDMPNYYMYERDGLTIIIILINKKSITLKEIIVEPMFNLSIYKNNERVASYYEDEAFDFLNEFFKNERRKLTISNMLNIETDNEHSKEV